LRPAGTFAINGYVATEAELAEIFRGPRHQALWPEKVGQPGAAGVVAIAAWYTLQSRVRVTPYSAPEVIEGASGLLAISFSKQRACAQF